MTCRLNKEQEPRPDIVNIYKGKEVRWNGKYYDAKTDESLSDLQKMHQAGEINLYEPIEAYYVEWYHNKDTYYPIEGTEVQKNLPPIAQQWKDSYIRSKRNG